MAQKLLNYEGLSYFLSKLLPCITVKGVDENSSNGVSLVLDELGGLSISVTPGSVASNNDNLVTGDIVYNAIESSAAFAVTLTLNQDGTYTTDKTVEDIKEAVLEGKYVYAIKASEEAYALDYIYPLAYILSLSSTTSIAIYYNNKSNISIDNEVPTLSEPRITLLGLVNNKAYVYSWKLAPIDSPLFTGTPTAPTPGANGTLISNDQIATVEYVDDAIYENADIVVHITNNNDVLTADISSNDVYAALLEHKKVFALMGNTIYTCLFAHLGLSNQRVINYYSFIGNYVNDANNTLTKFTQPKLSILNHVRTNVNVVTLDIAELDSPTLIGEPKAPTAELGTNNTQIATTAFVTQTIANAQIGKATFQGAINSLNDVSNTYKKGYHWLVQTAGTYFGKVCEIGDMVYCVEDSDATHDLSWSINDDFTVIQNNLDISIISNAEIDNLFTTGSPNDSSNNG